MRGFGLVAYRTPCNRTEVLNSNIHRSVSLDLFLKHLSLCLSRSLPCTLSFPLALPLFLFLCPRTILTKSVHGMCWGLKASINLAASLKQTKTLSFKMYTTAPPPREDPDARPIGPSRAISEGVHTALNVRPRANKPGVERAFLGQPRNTCSQGEISAASQSSMDPVTKAEWERETAATLKKLGFPPMESASQATAILPKATQCLTRRLAKIGELLQDFQAARKGGTQSGKDSKDKGRTENILEKIFACKLQIWKCIHLILKAVQVGNVAGGGGGGGCTGWGVLFGYVFCFFWGIFLGFLNPKP